MAGENKLIELVSKELSEKGVEQSVTDHIINMIDQNNELKHDLETVLIGYSEIMGMFGSGASAMEIVSFLTNKEKKEKLEIKLEATADVYQKYCKTEDTEQQS